ncbi:hypothetical protein NX862_09160 [Rhodobacter sp. KR11]|uniref:hypothetical protein n=1 Tax=Rhodobacter sp. KR11 TaxID=2974588 RepID=UPI002223AD7A|nr:hypothetical protein [Rhodobacter sp. KR11]MCW1918924.1 hypothetical protein [Rhodobacter sp. KR11]
MLLLLMFSAQFQVGLMPAEDASGQMVMVICSGDGPMMMVLDPQTGELRQAPPSTTKSGCHWASADVAVVPVSLPVVIAAPVRAVSHVTESDLWRPAHDPRGLWARGPPRLM